MPVAWGMLILSSRGPEHGHLTESGVDVRDGLFAPLAVVLGGGLFLAMGTTPLDSDFPHCWLKFIDVEKGGFYQEGRKTCPGVSSAPSGVERCLTIYWSLSFQAMLTFSQMFISKAGQTMSASRKDGKEEKWRECGTREKPEHK